MRVFELRVDLGAKGTVSRSIKAESEAEAVKLMRLKFPECQAVTVASSREQTEQEIQEEQRIRAAPEGEALQDSNRARDATRFRNGALIALFGIIASILAFDYGWLVYVTLAFTAFGLWKCVQARAGIRRGDFKRRHQQR